MCPVLCEPVCLHVYSWWIADNSKLCLHDSRQCRHSSYPCGPVAYALSWSPAILACAASVYRSALIFWSRSIVPQLFCCTVWSRSLTETIVLIWIIKGVRHYDTVSLCRGGQRTNIQAHCPLHQRPLLNTLLLIRAWNKFQGWDMNVAAWFGVKFVSTCDVFYRGQWKEVLRPHRHLLYLAPTVCWKLGTAVFNSWI